MLVKFRHLALALVALMIISSCKQDIEYSDDPIGEAMFELGRQMEPLQIDRLICAISIDTAALSSDIGKSAYSEVYYNLELKVAIPYSHAQIQDTLTYSYIPVDERCDQALTLTKRIIKDTNPKTFPDVKIITVEELKRSVRLPERIDEGTKRRQ